MILTQKGRPVVMLKNLDDDRVKTRRCHFKDDNTEKGQYIAKRFVHDKHHGQYSKDMELRLREVEKRRGHSGEF